MLNEQVIKEYLSKNVLLQENKSNENILRKVIFECSQVDWEKVEEVLKKEHPESKIWGSDFNGHRIDEKLLTKLNKEYPDITEYDWLYEYYITYESTRKIIKEVAEKNNNVVPKYMLKDYGLSPRHIQITFNNKYEVEY